MDATKPITLPLGLDHFDFGGQLQRLKRMKSRRREEKQGTDPHSLFERVRFNAVGARSRNLRNRLRWFKAKEEKEKPQTAADLDRYLNGGKDSVWSEDRNSFNRTDVSYQNLRNTTGGFEKYHPESFNKWMHSVDPLRAEDLDFTRSGAYGECAESGVFHAVNLNAEGEFQYQEEDREPQVLGLPGPVMGHEYRSDCDLQVTVMPEEKSEPVIAASPAAKASVESKRESKANGHSPKKRRKAATPAPDGDDLALAALSVVKSIEQTCTVPASAKAPESAAVCSADDPGIAV